MKLILSIIFIFFSISSIATLTFEERKGRLIKILQSDVGYHSSISIHHHHHHYRKKKYSSSSSESASLSDEVKKKLMRKKVYNMMSYGEQPQYFNHYPGAYQPYEELPYGYSYYTTSPPSLFNIFG
jgi:hypothetical protein